MAAQQAGARRRGWGGPLALVALAVMTSPWVLAPPAGAAGSARPEITEVGAERTDSGQYAITWSTAPGARVTSVRWGPTPGEIDAVLVDDVAKGTTEVVVDDPSPGARPYFELRTADGARRTVAERRIALEGEPNFRDLGGYETKDGRVVRWGQLYRSGELAKLTDADLATVDELGIKLVCDLRAPGEVAIGPDRLPAGVETVSIPITDDSQDPVAIRNAVLAGDVSALGAPGELLTDANAKFVTEHSDAYTTLMERVMEPAALPTNIHCTAGKDRAGVGAALVLLTLGVPEKTVMEDFLLTNGYRAASNANTLKSLSALLDPQEVEVMRGILEVRPEYLQAALDTMKDEYGSVDGYLRKGLGITPKERARFQRLMLDDPNG
jgi:protein-tyrosine phosphatase